MNEQIRQAERKQKEYAQWLIREKKRIERDFLEKGLVKNGGYMDKKSASLMGSWQQRYFDMVGTKIWYSVSPGDPPLKEPMNVRDGKVESSEGKKGEFMLTVGGPKMKKTYTMKCDTERDRDMWAEKLRIAVEVGGMRGMDLLNKYKGEHKNEEYPSEEWKGIDLLIETVQKVYP
eukprot:TRINITY_DN59558_c0_g1_i1.p1 TRINITY_DN59558_c0_g1~~TRINITY_DN59558_c0_g1_i1.p1  ORF type:complete len:185 (-),score=10.15 TRINITY_DN59558_c0_g1_i1:72-596(-)